MGREIGAPARNILLSAAILTASGYRLWGIAWGLQDADVSRRPHPDEWAIYWLWNWFDHYRSLSPCPNAAAKECFFDWGTVYIYLSYGWHFLLAWPMAHLPPIAFGERADPVFVKVVLAGRLFSALASIVTVLVVYLIGRQAYGSGAGVAAAWAIALSGLPIQLAHFATPDSTALLFLSLSLLGMILVVQHPTMGRYVFVGASIGLAAGAQIQLFLLVGPLFLAWYLDRQRRLSLLVLGLASAIFAFFLSNPYALLDTPNFLAALHHTLLIRTTLADIEYQGRFAAYGPDWLYVVRYPFGYGAGFAMTFVFLLGLGGALFRRQREDIVLLGWAVPYFLVISFSSVKFMRYSAPLFPVFALFAGRTVAEILWAGSRALSLVGRAGLVVAVLSSMAYDAAYVGTFASPDPRWQTTQWLRLHAALGSHVAFEQLPNGLLNLPYFISPTGFPPCIARFRTGSLAGQATYVMTDGYGKEEHPRISSLQVKEYQHALQHDRDYKLVHRVSSVPTFLGLAFPIAGAPHDWRYPDHEIKVYLHRSVPRQQTPDFCFPSLPAAIWALYTPLVSK
jgi:Dolichyl-phosphate-mannose-protein mannosyltransferase